MTIRLRPAEAVAAGHPDRLADSIADALVARAAGGIGRSLSGVEVAVHRDRVFVTGTIASTPVRPNHVAAAAMEVYWDAGYGEAWGPDPRTLQVALDLEVRPLLDGEHDLRACSADQSITTGYAVDRPGTGWLPPEHWLARRIMVGIAGMGHTLPALHLGPDGKVAVVCAEPSDGGPVGIDAVTVSVQQRTVANDLLTRRAILAVIRAAAAVAGETFVVPDDLADRLLVNGAGDFERGGPYGDNGLSGKKLVVDAYGPRVPIGGGALCGKDFYKVDRSGAIIARRLALGQPVLGAPADPAAEHAGDGGLARAHESHQIQLVGFHARSDSSTEKNSG